ncbi:bifunctional 4-hydroxy-2-oxoglutarate aldolase/2-dehydro-3-deoxy-phosphogluconate aldolase [uncultured Microbacterium sp.]|uniref:bifunctional 4-hydroxy-2-oxoglutarate aldolase/2-dehydro-3-deoxy-phosphogluconate aldolase n=1 Tax=uncultured Microbacterium sp. TaxID=191216 RepID=UPI0025EC623A|nr:2-dehydro-3-deoxyphosphogluconate aldolase [uncultured Microbacterium sp.]
MTAGVMDLLREDGALALPRLASIPDPLPLLHALAAGGIRVVEFAFTTPRVTALIEAGSEVAGVRVGAGTVTTAAQARDAIAAGASFLVTPGVVDEVAAIAGAHDVPVVMGALTPTEALAAVRLGAAAVKIFPAETVGAAYFRHLSGPFPDMPLVASGGLHDGNAAEYRRAGALAVTAGSSVVSAADVAANDWERVSARARAFVVAARG